MADNTHDATAKGNGAAPKPSNNIVFTDSESAIMLSIMRHLTADIQFDADAVASELGYKSGGVLKVRWGQIKNKKLSSGSETVSPTPVKKRKAATPNNKGTPRKAMKLEHDGVADPPATPTSALEGDDDDANVGPDTPTKAINKAEAKSESNTEVKMEDANGEDVNDS